VTTLTESHTSSGTDTRHVRVRHPNRGSLVRLHVAGALHTISCLVASYREDNPSPCCGRDDEWPVRNPRRPGWLVCSADGTQYRARGGAR
jgi:hypothetical protein